MPWPVHPTGFLGARGDSDTYLIERSLRFNSADSTYLNRTPASAGNRKTWTWSGWIKLSSLVSQPIYLQYTNSQNQSQFGQNSSSKIRFYDLTSNVFTADIIWTPLYRDPSGWYNIMLSVDTTQATNTNRVKLFVNGIQVTQTDSATWPSQNSDLRINNNTVHYQGWSGGSDYVNGYLTEIYFIDGQALTPSSFGETDAITGRWKAKAYSGTYGTNGFYLKFADNSGTTATTLGKDSSGNGNNWTPNNFSVTAGAGNDSLVDSPTNYGADSYSTSADNARGNYATLNPLSTISTVTISNGNLDYSSTTASKSAIASIGVNSGKYYWEVSTTAGSTETQVGVYGSSASTLFNLIANSTVYGLRFNADDGTLERTSDGISWSSIATGLTSGPYFPYFNNNGTTAKTVSINFGQRPFAYAAPTGYKALCTTNLTIPTINKPSKYMDALAYTGTGASNAISSFNFSPDLVWIKNRGTTTDHALYDIVRGAQAQLSSNTTGTEVTSSTGLTSFDGAGFTLGTSSLVNTNGTQYVAWSWDAGGTTSTNTSGSITSTVRANTQAGFSIVSYTGNGSNTTVGHGLGIAPAFYIIKGRSGAVGATNWTTYHKSLGSAQYLQLNTTSSAATSTTIWQNTNPTSSVFYLSNVSGDTNGSGSTYIAYCFAEIEGYSKFGSYIGNGSADGPFVWCGFRPKWVLIKNSSDAVGRNWGIQDSSRDIYNTTQNNLNSNTSDAENSGFASGTFAIDILSNGFKVRNNSSLWNGSGNTIIFAAFAETPFKYARAR